MFNPSECLYIEKSRDPPVFNFRMVTPSRVDGMGAEETQLGLAQLLLWLGEWIASASTTSTISYPPDPFIIFHQLHPPP